MGGVQWLAEGEQLYGRLKILDVGCQVLEVFVFT
jgi:hypothetical protein